jgi:hypothetical protein
VTWRRAVLQNVTMFHIIISPKRRHISTSHRPPSTSPRCDNPNLATSQLAWPRPTNADIFPPSVISLFFSDLFPFFHYSCMLSFSYFSFLYFFRHPATFISNLISLSYTTSSFHFRQYFVIARSWCRGHILAQSLHAVPRDLPHLYLPREQTRLMWGIPRSVRC